MGPNSLAKCERKDECARDAIGTVRTSMDPPGGDVQSCKLHAGGLVVWRFGEPSPYKTSNPVGQQRRSSV
jgi:hypothetical protein